MLGFPGASGVRNPPASEGDPEDEGSIPGSGKSPEEEMVTYFSILAWKIPWTKKPGGLQFMGLDCKESDMTKQLTHTHTHTHIALFCICKCVIIFS